LVHETFAAAASVAVSAVDAFETAKFVGASGAACGSLFNFGDNNPLRAKAFLKNYNIPLKLV
jgi:cyclase